MILIIDTQINNLTSVTNAFKRLGCITEVGCSLDQIEKAKAIILPGVGAFEKGMAALNEKGISSLIRRRVIEEKVPILGICLGMQLLAEGSDEHGQHEGLGLIKGRVERLQSNDSNYKIPNIGWCTTQVARSGIMFPKMTVEETFYYIHSHYINPADATDVAATINFSGRDIPVAIERDNIFGAQFHPEKSQDSGLDLIKRFLDKINSISVS